MIDTDLKFQCCINSSKLQVGTSQNFRVLLCVNFLTVFLLYIMVYYSNLIIYY